ncbi:unnamed protein product, partial [Amoebophrya sp. A25]|eukprot:GSA25T00009659001.1
MGQGIAGSFLFPKVNSGRRPVDLTYTPEGTPILYIDYEQRFLPECDRRAILKARLGISGGDGGDGMEEDQPPVVFPPGCVFQWVPYRRRCMLYFHGNGEDLGQLEPVAHRIAHRLGMSVLMVEYPAYGVFQHGWTRRARNAAVGSSDVSAAITPSSPGRIIHVDEHQEEDHGRIKTRDNILDETASATSHSTTSSSVVFTSANAVHDAGRRG